ncbi:hypothetical protein [Candidatus Neptunichlamydia sp. REUL1]|uniref:hypothetical protein n=1 Tax=Candidatus Neptunichlamydia sp. REUL1 TaxID=3064277 RepID=UPI002931510D|nr:hypothetical protein [Candidatus Neptunochlamydia sp. REUL1]
MFRAAEFVTSQAIGAGIPIIGTLNAIDATVRIGAALPYVSELLHFTGSETLQVKEFHKALEHLEGAYKNKDVQEILVATKHVQEKLAPLLENESSYYDNFKGWSRFFSRANISLPWQRSARWKNYLKPLHDLNAELTRFQHGATSTRGYDLSDMGDPLNNAVQFINHEIKAQTGFVNKLAKGTLNGVVNAGREKYKDLTGVHAPKRVVHTPVSPLMKLLADIGEFKTDQYIPAYLAKSRLNEDIEALTKSNPFFAGLPAYIDQNINPQTPLLISLDQLVTDYIVEKLDASSAQPRAKQFICQAIYDFAAKGYGVTREGEDQQAFGKAFLEGSLENPAQRKVLWQAVAYVLDLDKVTALGDSLAIGEDTTLSDISEKIDRSLSYLSSVRSIPEASRIVGSMVEQIASFGEATYALVRSDLHPEQAREVEATLRESNRKLKSGDLEGALKELNTLYESGPVARLAVRSYRGEEPQSVVGELASSFALKTEEVAAAVPNVHAEQMIEDKKAALVESLTFFSAFQVVDKYCGYTGVDAEEDAVQRRYKTFYTVLERVEGPETRKALFISLLNDKIESRSELGFFDKWMGKQLCSFTVSLVEYFSKQFTDSVTEHLQAMMLDPINDPLTNNHMGPVRAANNAMLALLYAEERWRSDTTGELGTADKQKKIFEIIENSGGISTEKLFKRVVDKALDHFLAYNSYGDFFKEWKASLTAYSGTGSNPVSRFLRTVVSLAGRGVLGIATLPLFVGYAIKVWGTRIGASMLISRLDLINSTLDSIRDSIYSDSKYTNVFDKILLDQLKAVEKLLESEEGGTTQLLAGSNEKRLVSELVSNLFRLIDERTQLTPGKQRQRDNLLGELVDSFNGMSDAALQDIIRDIIIFSYESIRTEQGVNNLFLGVLDQATQSMRPNDLNRLWELYTEEEQISLGADPKRPETIAVLEADFARKRGKASTQIIKRDIDVALQELYASREQELQKVLGCILHNTVEKVVKEQVDSILKTPQDTILGLTTFLENQLLPHVQLTQTMQSEISYIEEMQRLAHRGDIQGLKKRHTLFLNQLQNQLTEMKVRKGRDDRSDLQIQMLERMVARLVNLNLRALSSKIAAKDLPKIKRHLQHLAQVMRKEENTIIAIRYNIKTQEKTVMDHLSEKSKAFVKWGAENLSPVVREYVKSRLGPRFEGMISLYRDPSVFTAALREGIREYGVYQRDEPASSPFKRVSSGSSESIPGGFELI